MREILADLERWRARGEPVAVATVVGVERSAPRPPGAKLAVSGAGEIAGSVSGGCVEGAVVQTAEEILAGAPPALLRFGITDHQAWDVGLPCGGSIDVWVQAYVPGALERAARRGQRAAEVTALEGARAGAKLVIDHEGRPVGSLGSLSLDLDAARLAAERVWSEGSGRHGDLFVDVVAPPPRLVLFGAGEVSVALCRLAHAAGWRTSVVDPRKRFATADRFPAAEHLLHSWPDEALRQLAPLDRATSVVVLTHDPKLDDPAIELALRSAVRFVGAMGSRSATAARRQRLLARGVDRRALDRLAAPVGLDLGAADPDETALSIFAELVAARHGRDGGRLRDACGTIHPARA